MRATTSIRTRLLASLLAVAVISAAGLSLYFLDELESYGLRKLEERLGSEARLLAAVVSPQDLSHPDALDEALQSVRLPGVSWVGVLDERGVVVADSAKKGVGADYGERPEVRQALVGSYGAHTRATGSGKLGLYVAYPIYDGTRVVGAAYSSAETFSIVTLLHAYRVRLAIVVLLFVAATFVLAELLARWLSSPLQALGSTAEQFAAGDHAVRVKPAGSRETRALGEAFNTMAEEVVRMVTELREEERRKSRFVSDVSHELRTPLTAIRGTAETLLDGDVEPEDADRFLATIVRESERLARLADDLLTLQRIEGATGELPLRQVDLRQVAERAVSALEPLIEQREVRVEVLGEAPTVLGDADRLQQVVANLVDNGSRMMAGAGTITIELGTAKDGRAMLSVLDEGPGIPEAAEAHLFDRFYRAQASRDRSTGGAGLGLAIVKAIVTAHAGEIEVANRPGGGTRFTFKLPAMRSLG
ncbi:MAG: ATP-binding protein [Actinomycetota bacterium]|nr:ATP-binding protein [Actinomycetota bacterium]